MPQPVRRVVTNYLTRQTAVTITHLRTVRIVDPVLQLFAKCPMTARIPLWRHFRCALNVKKSMKTLRIVGFMLNPMHVQPVVPEIQLCDKNGNILATHHQALEQTASHLLNGKIVAIKGLGGFHLACDATILT